ncbi:HdaA/DnaA family protein [Falsiroseomonas tokyonensis]|uniref:Chromosomal replication initiator DnaA n=1 Tax=Falsiroseomonas tokyonensis TaxID=430521 RepID=A0ABV7BY22_9PROT|nr:chromosomal replication initiator DnaA [Falsiroseomonas tokyonensis]MBU8539092.1 chromosomal replication initiator DnaA [Falsiroseomonas tokyonensis]
MGLQLALPLPLQGSDAAEDLVPDPSNAEALAWLEAPPEAWPLRRLALHGPEGVGKTHMLQAASRRFGWRRLEGPGLTMDAALADAPGTALDRADAAPEQALFHLINHAAQTGAPLLLAARMAPARWPTILPDLASRLRATTAVEIAGPGEGLLAALLAKHLADRQLRVEAGVQAYLLSRLPRHAAAIAQAVAALDAASLAGATPVTRALARQILALDDRFETSSQTPSPPAGGLG